MYYRLIPELALKGWKGMSWVLVRRPNNVTRVLNRIEFETLLLCDGKTKVFENDLPQEMKSVLKRLVDRGFVVAQDEELPIDDEQCYKYYDNRYVETAFWSITGRCNYRCRHCYMDAPDAAYGELDHQQAIDLIDQMAACGVMKIDITGGEPFVRRDFWQLMDRLQMHKIALGQVYTNGWLLTESVLNEFECRNLRPQFSISFDGIGWHDWMRGIEGAERAAIRAIKLCREKGFATNVEMCIHRGNAGSLRETVNALAQMGIMAIKTSNVACSDLWIKNSEGLALTEEEYVDNMIEYIPSFYEDGMPLELMLSGVVSLHTNSREYSILAKRYENAKKSENCHLCGAARYACYISPEGRMLPCMPMTMVQDQSMFPLIKNIGLKKGLSDSFYMEYVDRKIKELLLVNEKCNACEHKYECGGGCRARAMMGKDHDLMGCDYNQCMMFEKGYPDKIRAVCDAAIAKYCPDAKKDNE